jgi:hypothetical protein
MTTRFSRAVPRRALAVGLTAASVFGLGALMSAESAFANVPTSGANCQTDGKISGRGSTFQNVAQSDFMTGFQNDICGSVGTDSNNASDPSGTYMLSYNGGTASSSYSANTLHADGLDGSGQGITAIACRTDAFGGTDIPYSTQSLSDMGNWAGGVGQENAALPTSIASSTTGTCGATFTVGTTHWAAPDMPNSGGSFPATTDPAASASSGASGPGILSVPIAGSATALGVNASLLASGCSTDTAAHPWTATQGLQLTQAAASRIYGGDDATWGSADIVATNPGLSGCTLPILRVVRKEGSPSGTTELFKNALYDVDPSRTLGSGTYGAATCQPSLTWTQQAAVVAANQAPIWPSSVPGSSVTEPSGSGCSALVVPGSTGGSGVVNQVIGSSQPYTGATIGYADVADWKSVGPTNVVYASIQSASQAASGLTSPAPTYNPAGALSGYPTAGSPVFPYPTASNPNASNNNLSSPSCNFAGDALPGSGAQDLGDDFDTNWADDEYLDNNATLVTPGVSASNLADQGTQFPICGLTFDLAFEDTSGLNGNATPIGGLNADQRRTLYSYILFILTPAGQATLPGHGYDQLPANWLLSLRQQWQALY